MKSCTCRASLSPRSPPSDDGFALYETQAIMRYVDERFPGTPLQPEDVHEWSRMNQIIGIVDAYAWPSIAGAILFNRMLGGDPTHARLHRRSDRGFDRSWGRALFHRCRFSPLAGAALPQRDMAQLRAGRSQLSLRSDSAWCGLGTTVRSRGIYRYLFSERRRVRRKLNLSPVCRPSAAAWSRRPWLGCRTKSVGDFCRRWCARPRRG